VPGALTVVVEDCGQQQRKACQNELVKLSGHLDTAAQLPAAAAAGDSGDIVLVRLLLNRPET